MFIYLVSLKRSGHWTLKFRAESDVDCVLEMQDEIENLLMTELCRRLRVDIFMKEVWIRKAFHRRDSVS